ncbi:M3 family metallopeptidase [Piscinibacter sakaiensis]|uniref:oligopeptidase A n=1 Tax=Piscinibacter sakaiensis TaxID=1547922 RepID=A0A0K8P143_PISS1|nr:M3 family metallopeptidase [Piscinibacter sakaiensis]GAP36351.1 oligopeptidase A [Piscinibacter sakaiensis]
MTVEPTEVRPAIEALIGRAEAALAEATRDTMAADAKRLAAVLDMPVEALGEAWGAVMHLHAVSDTPALREAVRRTQPLVTSFYARLASDERLYALLARIEREGSASLGAAGRRALSNSLRSFRLAGAELAAADKARFVLLQQRLGELSREFSNHELDATDAFVHWATADDLEGVPPDALARMKAAARDAGRPDMFKVTLQQPCLVPVLQYARNRGLREALYRANVTRASESGPAQRDNGPVIAEIMALRQERAALLGMASHAEVSLETKMAESPAEVAAFLRDLSRRSRGRALAELDELSAWARDHLALERLEPWDLAYATEALRQARYRYSDQDVQRHFRLDEVMAGLFDLARCLFDVSFHVESTPAWHPDVRSYRVERHGELLGRFFLDPYARVGKRAGAWMNGAQPRWRRPDGSLRTALAYLVTNFAAPADATPARLRHADVVTLFHEFGHGLHFLLCEEDTLGVSGLSGVEWDAVELPSQLMENFAWQWPVLEQITRDPETGEHLPRALFDQMIAARNFQGGLGLLRQVELALFDLRLHAEPSRAGQAQAVLDEVRTEVAVVRSPAFNRFQNTFSHVFAGGYAAGYYSYLWAEVLASDAWDVFEQAGGVDATVGRRYLDSILARGGSRPMAESFEAFRGRRPTVDALLRQRGLLAQPA